MVDLNQIDLKNIKELSLAELKSHSPSNLLKFAEKIEIDNTILINAWDCWSVPGNGNSNDNSLDGYMGRFSEIGYLGTSLTNPYLLQKGNIIGL